MKKNSRILVLVLLAAVIIGALCLGRGALEQKRYQAQFLDVFDTVTELIGYAKRQEDFRRQAGYIKDKLLSYHKLYDIYHDYQGINNIKTINDNAGIRPVKVDGEIIELLKFSKDMYERTNGQVNIAYGSVLSLWHQYRQEGIENPGLAALPSKEELLERAGHTDIENIIINEEEKTVYLKDKEMSLDVGSIGKGYAVGKTAEYAKAIGMENVLLSVGGNICAVGERMDHTPWRLGIRDPLESAGERYIKKVDLRNKCVVTSGNYQRYYIVDGKRYCHIIDPDTAMPADYFASVSVITEDSALADALSTALYNMEYEEGAAFLEEIEGVEAMWIMEDGEVRYSSGFSSYLAGP